MPLQERMLRMNDFQYHFKRSILGTCSMQSLSDRMCVGPRNFLILDLASTLLWYGEFERALNCNQSWSSSSCKMSLKMGWRIVKRYKRRQSFWRCDGMEYQIKDSKRKESERVTETERTHILYCIWFVYIFKVG